MAKKKELPNVDKKQSGCGCGCMAATPKDAKAIKPATEKPKK
jgi:hypothetical protein